MFCGFCCSVKAERADTANPYFEINRMMATMASANHISFNAAYYYEDYDSSGYKRDTLRGLYKINGQQYYAQLDSSFIIQNSFYNISVNKKDSTIIIGRPQAIIPALMQNDMMNPTLQSVYLSKIVLSDSLNTRKMSFVFNDNSPYSAYELSYDTVTYNLNYVKYRLRHYKIFDPLGLQSTYYTQVYLALSNYQLGAFTDSVFDTSVYISTLNEVFTPVPAYSSFTIFNQVMNQ
jgi:hypothetical protein